MCHVETEDIQMTTTTEGHKLEYIDKVGMRNIICGVIRLAVRDWKSSYKILHSKPTEKECRAMLERNPEDKIAKRRLNQIASAKHVKAETERFFKSEWFKELKEASGVALPKDMISALYARVEEEKIEKAEKEKKRHESKECKRSDSGQDRGTEDESHNDRDERETAQDFADGDKDGDGEAEEADGGQPVRPGQGFGF